MPYTVQPWNIRDEEDSFKSKVSKFWTQTFPRITGKFGFSIMLGRKELFFGVAVADVEMEKVIRQVKTRKAPRMFKKAKVVPVEFAG